jgi:hypothetical protein
MEKIKSDHSYEVNSILWFHKNLEKKLYILRNNISLDEFTNVFIEEGYLDENNAKVMNKPFSQDTRAEKILWKKSLLSLLTFIFLVDFFKCLKIQLWDKQRDQSKSIAIFIKRNFLFLSKNKMKSYDKSTIYDNWNFIKNAINECYSQYSKTIKPKVTKDKQFYYEIISYYAQNTTPFNDGFTDNKYDNKEKSKLDLEIVNIFCRISSKDPENCNR